MKHFALRISALILIIIIVMIVLGFVAYILLPRRVKIAKNEIIVHNEGIHLANQKQFNASVLLFSFDDMLYFVPHSGTVLDQSSYDCCLSVFSDATAKKLFSIGRNRYGKIVILGSSSHYLYYYICGDSQSNDLLYCYDIAKQHKSLLYSGHIYSWYHFYSTNNGELFIKLREYSADRQPQFLHIMNDRLIDIVSSIETYRIGNETYWLQDGTVYRQDQDSITTELIGITRNASRYVMIPCEQGLLIHCFDSEEDILYLIDTNGNLHEIFKAECLRAYSAVTVCGDYAYLSLRRYKEFGEIGMRRFENDTVEGLYRISLNSYCSEKISDKIFDGLYNFDDTCLWACDNNCNIFQLDLDGTVLCEAFHVYTYSSRRG